jgi:Tfp pilus assembly protein PilO
MKIIVLTIIIIFICFILYETYIYYNKLKDKKTEYENLKQKLEQIKKTYSELNSKLKYLSNTQNLLKELRKEFNYKLPDEKFLILIPQKESSTLEKQQ